MIFQLRPEFEQATGSAQPIGHLLLVGVQRVQFDPDRSGDICRSGNWVVHLGGGYLEAVERDAIGTQGLDVWWERSWHSSVLYR